MLPARCRCLIKHSPDIPGLFYKDLEMKAEEIKKVHCFFEQSGTFKNEFIKLGIPAEDYDIQNNFGQTDHVIDLFKEIETEYDNLTTSQPHNLTIFDRIDAASDLVFAFFPCIHFCDAKTLIFRGLAISQKNKTLSQICRDNIGYAQAREYFYELLLKFTFIAAERKIKLIIENPYNWSGMTYLENNFFKPAIIDKNRMLRGDYFIKPTGYWYFNLEPTARASYQNDKEQKTITRTKGSKQAGLCSEERSMISPDYARNFICDFILGKQQDCIQQKEFDFFS